jgi:hypothetical protein
MYKTSNMCVFPASQLKVHTTNEKGLADEQSSFADFFGSWRCLFCSWRHPFSPDGMRDSVVKGSKFQPKNIKRAEKDFEGLGN